jgi:hypothetical protein
MGLRDKYGYLMEGRNDGKGLERLRSIHNLHGLPMVHVKHHWSAGDSTMNIPKTEPARQIMASTQKLDKLTTEELHILRECVDIEINLREQKASRPDD